MRRRGGNGGGVEEEEDEESESLSEEELSYAEEGWEVDDLEEREASRVEELVWVSEELIERALFCLFGRRRLGEGVLEGVDERSVSGVLIGGSLRKASAMTRPRAVERMVFIVAGTWGIGSYFVRAYRRVESIANGK